MLLSEIKEVLVAEDTPDVNNAYDKWSEAIKLRADASERMVEMVLELSPMNIKYQIGDAPVNHFLSMINCNTITVNKHKSPDIMLFIPSSNMMYIGDVAVTRNARAVRGIKSEKYDSMRNEVSYKNPNVRVEELNVIFDESNDNVDEELKTISTLVGTPWNLINARDYTDCVDKCKVVVSRVMATVSNVAALQKMMAAKGKENEMIDFFSGTEQMRIPDISEAVYDEEHYANLIFNEMRLNDNPDSSDVTQSITKSSILASMEGLAKNNYRSDSDKINHNLQFLINCDEIKTNQTTIDILVSMCIDLDITKTSKIREVLPSSSELLHMKSMELERKAMKESKYMSTDEVVEARNRMVEKYGKSTPYYCAYKHMAKKAARPYAETYLSTIREKTADKRRDKEKALLDGSQYIMPCIPPENWKVAEQKMASELQYYSGSPTSADKEVLLSSKITQGQAVTNRDKKSDAMISLIEDVIYNTRAFWLLKAVTKLVQDVRRMDPRLSDGVYYSNSRNSDSLILIHCNNSGFKTNQYYDFQCLTRYRKGHASEKHVMTLMESQGNKQVLLVESTPRFTYILTKMAKYDIDTLEQVKDNDKTVPMLVMNLTLEFYKETYNESSSLAISPNVKNFITTNMAFYTLLSVDLHQKPSVIMDLMKYVVSMPFSERCNFKMLLKDLLPFKTKFDVFLFKRMVDYFHWNKLNAKTFKSKTYMLVNGQVATGAQLDNKFTTFVGGLTHHNSYYHFMEGQMLNQIRPKKLYNEQFLDQACTDIIERNIEYEQEKIDYGSWTVGHTRGPKYPFSAKYCYSRDVVIQASDKLNRERAGMALGFKLRIAGRLSELAVNHLSMRKGCISNEEIEARVKSRQQLQVKIDEEEQRGIFKSRRRIHELKTELSKVKAGKSKSALLAGLEALEKHIRANDTTPCQSINVLKANRDKVSQYNTSSKQQRGKGRQIASADFYTKNGLHCIEEVYKAQSSKDECNLLRAGVNRARALSQTCEKTINEGILKSYEHFYYLVEDQTKWSESDNVGKMKVMIECDIGIPSGLKMHLIRELTKMEKRMVFSNKPLGQQPVRRMKPEYKEYITENGAIRGKIGWMQGMLNFTSTDCARRCTLWAVETFNKYYKGFRNTNEGDIIVKSALNSDDSFHAVSGPSKRKIMDFRNYLFYAKKYFCMKLNIKKSYISRNFGEMIQLYVDGNSVLNIWMKQMYSGFGGLMGISYEKDMNHAISHCGTLTRQGADEINVRTWWLTARKAVLEMYNMSKGGVNDLSRLGVDPKSLPVSLFGYPTGLSQYTLNMHGVRGHNDTVEKLISKNPSSNERLIMMMALLVKIEKNNTGFLARHGFKVDNEIMKQSKFAMQCSVEPGDDMDPTRHEDDILLLEIEEDGADTDFGAKQLSVISTRLPIKHKTADVLKKLESLTSGTEPSGVQGLIRNNSNIKTCLKDRLETSQKEMIELSESNFTTNPKLKALCNSYLASRKCFYLKGFPKDSFTALGVINHLLSMARCVEKTMEPDILESAKRSMTEILTDNTMMTDLTKEIERIEGNNTIIMSAAKRSKVVNSYPVEIGDVEFENHISHVLCEIVKPGALEELEVKPRAPHKLHSEMLIVKNLYKSWFSVMKGSDGSLLKAALDIYHNELAKRIQKTVISSHLDSRTKAKFYRDIYLNCYYPGYKIVSEAVLPPGIYKNPDDKAESDVNTLLALFEIHSSMKAANDDMTRFSVINYRSELSGLVKPASSDNLASDILVVIKQASRVESKRKLAVFYEQLGFGPSEIIKTIKAMQFGMTWHVEQKHRFESGRKVWYGPFKVTITKGDTAVTVEGEPGNIERIVSNTENLDDITKAMTYLTSYASFPGYSKTMMHSHNEWGRNPFWSSYAAGGAPYGLYFKPNQRSMLIPLNPIDSLMTPLVGRPLLIKEGQKLPYIPVHMTTRSLTIDFARLNASQRAASHLPITVDMQNGKILEVHEGYLSKVVGTFKVKSWMADYSKLRVNPGDIVMLDGLNLGMAINRGWAEDIIKGTTKKLEKSDIKMLLRNILGESRVAAETIVNLFGAWCEANNHIISVESALSLSGIPEVMINIGDDDDDEQPNMETLEFTMGNTGDVVKDLLLRLLTTSTNYQRAIQSSGVHVFRTPTFTNYMMGLKDLCDSWDGTPAVDKILADCQSKERYSRTMLDSLLEFGFFTRQDAYLKHLLNPNDSNATLERSLAASTYGGDTLADDNDGDQLEEDDEPSKEADALTDLIESLSSRKDDADEGWY
ncbi:RNA-dependent RNA polymerase [Spilikins virus]|uniref:RNA-directed RNA polymerase L n=1 Tax=Spilikins virus TaxID=2895617 RepID=A0AAE9CSM1_9VIRU|nr:RNA-dependent RNA polymerase [Spilikins virus]